MKFLLCLVVGALSRLAMPFFSSYTAFMHHKMSCRRSTRSPYVTLAKALTITLQLGTMSARRTKCNAFSY
jgi:hypothetical protein